VANIIQQSALAGHYTENEFAGDGHGGAGVILQERRPSAIAQINGAPDESELNLKLGAYGLEPKLMPNRSSQGKGIRLMWNGPGMWLTESATVAPADLVGGLRNTLGESDATVTDISHARTIIRITGPAASDLLCKGSPLDIESLRTNDCASTLLGHLSVLINTIDDGYDVYAFRSFGLALWEWLTHEAEEFGYQVAAK